jgi:hypothetical protein
MLNKKKVTMICLAIAISCIILTTGLSASSPEPFSLHYNLAVPATLGTGVSGQVVLALINNSGNTIRDIIIRVPEPSKFLFGPNNHCQAGTLKPGEQVVIQEHLFDPEGISKTGTLRFIVDYADQDGNRGTVAITAVGNVGVPHE